MNKIKKKIAIIGVGYVGLPLLVSLNKHYECVGYDISKNRINELKKHEDSTNTFKKSELKNILFTSNLSDLKAYNTFIVTVPTPVKTNNKPDLTYLMNACIEISKVIKVNDLIIFESTYAPFTTKTICIKMIEKKSKIKSDNFYFGYSPERLNPGDKTKDLKQLTKIIASETAIGIKSMKEIYSKICKKIYVVKNIEVAESAKIIENIQRDINIAYFNNLTEIFTKLNIDSSEIFKAAATKWNFINMKPGLVGGHCIPVDPYYFHDLLIKKKMKSNFLISGRKINENFKYFVIKKIKKFIKSNFKKKNIKIIFLGLAYKPNVPDFRNSKAIEIYQYFKKIDKNVKAYDPYLKKNNRQYLTKKEYQKYSKKADLIIKLVNHNYFNNKKFNNILSINRLLS